MPEIFISKSERETENIAYNLAKENKMDFGDIIALYGDLGAGKTAFTRGLAKFFSPESRVTSPTFSLVNEYKINDFHNGVAPGASRPANKKILHFDMYRINSEEDLLSVGFYDYLEELGEKIIIIEWFEKIADFFDENTVKIKFIKLAGDENQRKIVFERLRD
ncbi:MAG: tRNA (adenosine(37)-N6)-threonylcarbamoyltransferase complex ATPase subunit type 1 TsaE [Oscillospiraceae bacterium]|nr:tRNA (adenosine(37)-N6)-threonylcarbamoyltransferase complex ATPase subunit type 1 TsaE [Oscillospiraceae bacterium]